MKKVFRYLLGSPLIVATVFLVEYFNTGVETALELGLVVVLDSSFDISE